MPGIIVRSGFKPSIAEIYLRGFKRRLLSLAGQHTALQRRDFKYQKLYRKLMVVAIAEG
jgi:hypothetical protein